MNLDNDDFLINDIFNLDGTQENEEPGQNMEETQENEEPGENLQETFENEEPGENLQETQENEEPGQNIEETQEEIFIDYKQDFVMLENLTFIQVSLMGVLVFYFVLSLVVKFIKSFF